MSKACYILIALICGSPVILLWDGLIMQGFIAGFVAIALAITARTLHPGETEFLVSASRPAGAIMAVPALWCIFQILPLKVLANPIWSSAESALGHTILGTISVDPPAGVLALGQYLSLGAIAFVSAAVAIDRQRAESLLFALTGACATIGLIIIMRSSLFPDLKLSTFVQEQLAACVAMGAIIASTTLIRTYERYETRGANPQRSMQALSRFFVASSVALAICVVALITEGSHRVLVAMGCGFVVLAGVTIVRRIGLGAWVTTAIAMTIVGVAVLLITAQPSSRSRSLVFAFANSPTAIGERMLEDAPLVGTGAGTFAVLAPIYRELDDSSASSVVPTAAAAFAIELGRPMLWLIAAAVVGLIVSFLKAALQRGRDSFYPAMGGSCLVTLSLLAFIDAGLLGNAAGLIIAAVLGLAIAQSKSRTAQL